MDDKSKLFDDASLGAASSGLETGNYRNAH
jgi:hypothetical protein